MKTMNFGPIFRYRLKDDLKGSGIFFGIMVVLTAGLILGYFTLMLNGHVSSGTEGTVSAFSFAAAVMLFVIGISTIREDLRLSVQNGIGRRSAYLANIAAAAAISLILAAAGELLTIASVAAAPAHLHFSDIFGMTYIDGTGRSWTFLLHIESVLFTFSVLLLANAGGTFLSALFYRLNKAWTIVVAIGLPLLILNGFPIMLTYWSAPIDLIFKIISNGPMAAFALNIAFSVIFMIINWLLLRKAPIKAAKK